VSYKVVKGVGSRKVRRADREKYMTLPELEVLLKKVAETRHPKWRRDHAAIFCGFFLGLRVSEAVLLTRDALRDLAFGQLHIRTTKQGLRVVFVCAGCKRRFRVAAHRSGEEQECGHCGTKGIIRLPRGTPKDRIGPPEKSPPVVEQAVQDYLTRYVREAMRPEQNWLFEAAPGKPMTKNHLRNIFNSYIMLAGLNPKYSWHTLRHGRGVLLADQFDDIIMVRDSLRQRSVSAAEFYMHLSPRKQAKYRDALDGVSQGLDLGLDAPAPEKQPEAQPVQEATP